MHACAGTALASACTTNCAPADTLRARRRAPQLLQEHAISVLMTVIALAPSPPESTALGMPIDAQLPKRSMSDGDKRLGSELLRPKWLSPMWSLMGDIARLSGKEMRSFISPRTRGLPTLAYADYDTDPQSHVHTCRFLARSTEHRVSSQHAIRLRRSSMTPYCFEPRPIKHIFCAATRRCNQATIQLPLLLAAKPLSLSGNGGVGSRSWGQGT